MLVAALQRCLVLVTFNPKLEDRDIKEEALRLLLKAKQTKEDSKKLLEEEVQLSSIHYMNSFHPLVSAPQTSLILSSLSCQ